MAVAYEHVMNNALQALTPGMSSVMRQRNSVWICVSELGRRTEIRKREERPCNLKYVEYPKYLTVRSVPWHYK